MKPKKFQMLVCLYIRNEPIQKLDLNTGTHTPSHSLFKDPFKTSFIFGSTYTKGTYHVTMPSAYKTPASMSTVCACFSGTNGDLLITSPKNILVVQPKESNKECLTYFDALFPSNQTHKMHTFSSQSLIRIVPGSIIIGIDPTNMDQSSKDNDPLVCATFFLTVAPKDHKPVSSEYLIYVLDNIRATLKHTLHKLSTNDQGDFPFESRYPAPKFDQHMRTIMYRPPDEDGAVDAEEDSKSAAKKRTRPA